MSVLGRKWLVRNESPKSTLEKILENRNFSSQNELTSFHGPYLFTDMAKARERILKAIHDQEKIVVFGDYDVDGISGTAIVVKILQLLGANVSYRLPNRVFDGYGLSEKFIDEFAQEGIKLIITVDCGISCFNEVARANQYGIDTIITDHHTIPENIPEAYAILHPKLNDKYPFRELTGAGVALKLAQALIPDQSDEFVELATLGTVADLGPLVDENRLIVKRGLKSLTNTKWAGLKYMIELAKIPSTKEIDTGTIGFMIAPRINAAGRIDDPTIALELLLQDQYTPDLKQMGEKLEELNKMRQELTSAAIQEVEEHFLNQSELEHILIASHPEWHVGILGLVAGRLAEKYGRPAIILQDLGDTLVASARGPENFNITEAIADSSDLLINYGGHAQAAGFNIAKENLPEFKSRIEAYARANIQTKDLTPTIEIDCELPHQEISFNFLDSINNLKPFGVANTNPVFVVKNLSPQMVSQVGKSKEHLKFSTYIENRNVQIIGFNLGTHADTLRRHRKIDLVCHLERNIWNDKAYLQLRALDFREALSD